MAISSVRILLCVGAFLHSSTPNLGAEAAHDEALRLGFITEDAMKEGVGSHESHAAATSQRTAGRLNPHSKFFRAPIRVGDCVYIEDFGPATIAKDCKKQKNTPERCSGHSKADYMIRYPDGSTFHIKKKDIDTSKTLAPKDCEKAEEVPVQNAEAVAENLPTIVDQVADEATVQSVAVVAEELPVESVDKVAQEMPGQVVAAVAEETKAAEEMPAQSSVDAVTEEEVPVQSVDTVTVQDESVGAKDIGNETGVAATLNEAILPPSIEIDTAVGQPQCMCRTKDLKTQFTVHACETLVGWMRAKTFHPIGYDSADDFEADIEPCDQCMCRTKDGRLKFTVHTCEQLVEWMRAGTWQQPGYDNADDFEADIEPCTNEEMKGLSSMSKVSAVGQGDAPRIPHCKMSLRFLCGDPRTAVEALQGKNENDLACILNAARGNEDFPAAQCCEILRALPEKLGNSPEVSGMAPEQFARLQTLVTDSKAVCG